MHLDFRLTRDGAIVLLITNQGVVNVMRANPPSSAVLPLRGRGNCLAQTSSRRSRSGSLAGMRFCISARTSRTGRGALTFAGELIQAALRIERDEARKLKLEPDELPTGAMFGSVEIVDCIRNSKSKWAIQGQWNWLLKNPRVLVKPIPFEGALGFIRVPKRLHKGVRFRTA